MKKIIKPLLLTLVILIVSCYKDKAVNGISEFEESNNVSDFASELWINENTFKGSFSDDYNTFFFFRKVAPEIEKYVPYKSNFINGKWEEPKIMDFYDKNYSYTYQIKIPEKNKLIFLSNKKTQKDTTQNPNYNFWEIELKNGKFGEPKELGYKNLIYNYNSQPCITKNGTLFFTSDLPDWSKTQSYKMELKNEKYLEPELFKAVNEWRKTRDWSVYEFCVSPDENFIVASILNKNGKGNSVDLYISYSKYGNWTFPKKLNNGINSSETENFPTITNDGKYLVFTRAFSEFKIIPIKDLK